MSMIVIPRNTSYPVSSLQSRRKEPSQWYRPSYYHDADYHAREERRKEFLQELRYFMSSYE